VPDARHLAFATPLASSSPPKMDAIRAPVATRTARQPALPWPALPVIPATSTARCIAPAKHSWPPTAATPVGAATPEGSFVPRWPVLKNLMLLLRKKTKAAPVVRRWAFATPLASSTPLKMDAIRAPAEMSPARQSAPSWLVLPVIPATTTARCIAPVKLTCPPTAATPVPATKTARPVVQ